MTADAEELSQEGYWRDRGLEPPGDIARPASVRDLRRRIARSAEYERPLLILGAGTHLRSDAITVDTFDAVVTTGCDRIASIDRTSGTVTVEAGVGWGELRKHVRRSGIPFALPGLHPADATLGGLLSSAEPTGLPADVVGLTACTASGRDYRYVEAPRKAAGPDLRHLFIGCEGAFGVILTVTFALEPRPDARLWRISTAEGGGDPPAVDAILESFADRDIRVAWSRINRTEAALEVAVHGPTALLKAWHRAAEAALPQRLTLQVQDDETCVRRRDAIEREVCPGHDAGSDPAWERPTWVDPIKRTTDAGGALATGPRPRSNESDVRGDR